MSPRCCAALVLVLLAAASVSGNPVQHVTENPAQTHDAIADVLELKDTEIGRRPLFNSVIKSINTACLRKEQVQLMNATLDIYAHVFSSILHRQHQRGSSALLEQLGEPSRSQVEASLVKLQRGMEDLKRRLSRAQHHTNHEEVLHDLRKIQVDDPVNQRRALAQFKEVYRAASVIASRTCGSAQ